VASGERYSGYPAVFGYSTGQTTDCQHLTAYDMDSNTTETAVRPIGAIDPLEYITPRSRPQFRMRTPDMLTLLTDVSLVAGKFYDEDSYFYYQERSMAGAFESGATHIGRRTRKGFMYVDSITAAQEDADAAVCNLIFVPLSDGTNPIVSHETALDLGPVVDPAYGSCYHLASPYHNGVELKGCQSMDLNMGMTFVATVNSPGAFDDLGSITAREPVFVSRFEKLDEFDAHQFTGDPVNTTFAYYLQKADPTNANGDGRIAKGTAAHIKISCTGGKVTIRTINAENTAHAVAEVTVKPTGTVSISLNSKIP